MSVVDTVSFKILSVNEQPYKGKNGKPDGIMYKAQSIVIRDGVTKIGQLFLSRDLIKTKPGDYFGEYAMDSSWDLDIGPVLVDLWPTDGGPSVSGKLPTAAAKPSAPSKA